MKEHRCDRCAMQFWTTDDYKMSVYCPSCCTRVREWKD
jgi:hypothetical protein